ncbi:stage III sporulation protein AA [Thermanaeromonas toyohensis ToBE]|uniref:Stage III sporulation protein AA n=1 Tax=Thermanaeromonas toyohensis ToBE TaxID=698762 RepID=A0A1W1VZ96_9FIRM|nr:stage III sporulation protein AA [Thermanaeromonas toyohensis]SMB98593.1 stage III sporulation protein AA [Thermanaeromonas toyohensis ToBE]
MGLEQVEEIMRLLPPALREIIAKLPVKIKEGLEEIRLRCHQPLHLQWAEGESWITVEGHLTAQLEDTYRVEEKDIQHTVQALTQNSLYALEEELRAGYITVKGGHRVGLAGETIVERGSIRTLKNISSLNIRLARSLPGCARPLLPYLVDPAGRPYHILVLSPPRCGKTTLLRDLIRSFSLGIPELGVRGLNVGVVDERSEIAGCYQGIPQLDVGPRTDVLDRCPKGEGLLMLVRAMGPEVVATDEVGKLKELEALQEALYSGVTLLASVHASTPGELKSRPGWEPLLRQGVWQRLILLSRRLGPGTVEAVMEGGEGRVLLAGPRKLLS